LFETKKGVEWLARIQHSRNSFLLDDRDLAVFRQNFLMYYRRIHRDYQRDDNTISGNLPDLGDGSTKQNNHVAAALSALAKLGFHGLKVEDLERLVGQDKMEPALKVMATVQAYFQGVHFRFSPAIRLTRRSLVSHWCFVDNISMVIGYELVRGVQLLWTRLGLGGPDAQKMCEEYVRSSQVGSD
jgi:hypothetical protein